MFKISSIHPNTKIIAKNSLYALIIKGTALGISFFSTPAFIKYFNNNEVLGLWYTLLSMLSWFLTFDLGIGNGIRNNLVKALSINDRKQIRRIVSSGIISVCTISGLLCLIGLIWIYNINLNKIFNISERIIDELCLRKCVTLIFCAIILRFTLSIINSIFYALQKSAVNNFLALCISILQYIFIIIFHFKSNEDALLNLSIAYLALSNLPIIIAGIYIFHTDLKDCVPSISFITRETCREIMNIGGIFFLCQIFYLIIANTNDFFISHFWSPIDTASYTFYHRISMLISMLVSLALTPTWSMITKAYVEKNYDWLMRLYKIMKLSGLLIVIIQFSIIPFLQDIMDLWLGKGILHVQATTAIAFACFGASFIYSSIMSTIVNGLAKMKLQLWSFGLGAVFKIIFIVLIAKVSDNWTWVVWANTFILIPYCIGQQLQLNSLFKKIKKETQSSILQY